MVEILCGIKPEMELHFSSNYVSISTSSNENVCLQSVWLPRRGSQEFDVNFVVVSREILIVRKLNENKTNEVSSGWLIHFQGFCNDNYTNVE